MPTVLRFPVIYLLSSQAILRKKIGDSAFESQPGRAVDFNDQVFEAI
jgi:hypothetical protein